MLCVGCQVQWNWNIGALGFLVTGRKLLSLIFVKHMIALFGAVVLKLVRTEAISFCSKRL